MQSEEMSFQSAFEHGQRLCCSDVYRKDPFVSVGYP